MKNPFDRCSEDYERFRPGYPAELFEWLAMTADLHLRARILDIGSGTAKGSLPYIQRGFETVSAEPSLAMIRQGLQSYPSLRYVSCTAEALPFQPESFDFISAAQCFHWMDPVRALPEFSRALKPKGFFAIFWNSRDLTREHIDFFEQLVVKFNPAHHCGYREKDWTSIVEMQGLFRVVAQRRFSFDVPMTVEDWIGLSRSISYIRAIGDALMPAFEVELREGMSRMKSTECPYFTHVWLAQKTGSGGA